MESKEVKFSVPWGHIAAKVYGPLKEKKVLMVHGILDNSGVFDRLLTHLPEEYQYVSIDLPGHGLSSAFPHGTPLQYFDFVYSISLVLDALGWKTCIYIGHSFGAQIGTYFSIMYPGKLEKMIAVDGILPFFVDDTINYVQDIYKLNLYAKDSGNLYTKDDIIYALKCRRQEALRTEAAEAVFSRAVTKVGNLYKYNRDPRLRHIPRPIFTLQQHAEALKRFTTPTLIIIADSSSRYYVVLDMLDKLKSVISDKMILTVVTVRGNHDVHNNYPERVAPHICKFLSNELQSKL